MNEERMFNISIELDIDGSAYYGIEGKYTEEQQRRIIEMFQEMTGEILSWEVMSNG